MAADPKIVLGSHSHMSCRSRVATWPPARPTTPSVPSSSARLFHEFVSLRREFPNMRSIHVLGKKVTGGQVIPTDAEDFEDGGAARL